LALSKHVIFPNAERQLSLLNNIDFKWPITVLKKVRTEANLGSIKLYLLGYHDM
jgi:hypothetical protein